MSERVRDWFECDGGYPEEASLERLRAHRFSDFEEARLFWLEDFPAICEGIGSCSVRITDGTDVLGRPIRVVQFSTGGWSGAEELIDAALSHFWLAHFHTQWRRGGHFWFELPAEPLPTKEQHSEPPLK